MKRLYAISITAATVAAVGAITLVADKFPGLNVKENMLGVLAMTAGVTLAFAAVNETIIRLGRALAVR